MTDTIVIGGGIFGATCARALWKVGRSVLIFDDDRPMSGSKPAGGLMKPSWFSGLGKGVYDPALEMLNSLYDIQQIEFSVMASKLRVKTEKVLRIPNSQIMISGADNEPKQVRAKVTAITGDIVTWDDGGGPKETKADLIVVAAGIWCRELIKSPRLEMKNMLQGRQGVSFNFPGPPSCGNIIKPWAPYKQLVAFADQTDRTWTGDGTAIKMENWNDDRERVSLERCSTLVDMLPIKATPVRGIRPYVRGVKPCLLEELNPGLWVCTGGAKNGTLVAGWAAHKLVEATS